MHMDEGEARSCLHGQNPLINLDLGQQCQDSHCLTMGSEGWKRKGERRRGRVQKIKTMTEAKMRGIEKEDDEEEEKD